MRRPEKDLFGDPVDPSRAERVHRIGYAARPGTGPKSQRCATCMSCIAVLSNAVRSFKCQIMAKIWDRPSSDIKPNAPACSEWSRRPFRATA